MNVVIDQSDGVIVEFVVSYLCVKSISSVGCVDSGVQFGIGDFVVVMQGVVGGIYKWFYFVDLVGIEEFNELGNMVVFSDDVVDVVSYFFVIEGGYGGF